MKKLIRSLPLLVLALGVTLPAVAGVHWGYEGDELPENWAKLSPEYQMCGLGRNQSPVNITTPIQAQTAPLEVHYGTTSGNIVNNGHTVQINEGKPDDYIVVDNQQYHLVQFHFHAPSENQINGKSYPMEGHFVHSNANGDLVVMAIMFEEGPENTAADQLLARLNAKENSPEAFDNIDIKSLLPANMQYYRFSGSLTTPPCSEGVTWIVLKQPMTLSKTEIDKFTQAFKHHNNRPIQPLNGRLIIEN
ncbi:carbonic anhydrase [Orbus hercynius]|uniref:Carbonic anhydrase n=1 Tax=Orbus hercynius TaxID=593135 RepID=A0A495RBZ3_9GAMM|nr:carbonic anhydrase family protein [Orbus hercynius]RKS84780.1 carbonic anhydrase [Orbus hercynius]